MAVDYQRSSDRIGSSIGGVTVFGLGAEPVPAALLDESFGGIGIALSSDVQLGGTLEVELSGVRRWAIVRGVQLLPSGCRVGLEWKAQALSRHFRTLNKIVQQSHGDDSKLARFARILPGGLCTMWKLFEGRKWAHMAESAERIRKEAAVCGITSISASAELLQAALAKALHSGNNTDEDCRVVKQAFDVLIQKCIHAANEQLALAAR